MFLSRSLVLLALAGPAAISAWQAPNQAATQENHKRLMELLQIKELLRGADGRNSQGSECR